VSGDSNRSSVVHMACQILQVADNHSLNAKGLGVSCDFSMTLLSAGVANDCQIDIFTGGIVTARLPF
jgi:hypothetical protein